MAEALNYIVVIRQLQNTAAGCPGGTDAERSTSGPETTHTVPNLTNGCTYRFWIIARNASGRSHRSEFGTDATPSRDNQAPTAKTTMPNIRMQAGAEARTFALGTYFTDPDGDDASLAYTATSTDLAVATAEASGTTLTVSAVAAGTASVTVTATDGPSLWVSQTFTVTVTAEPVNQPPTAGTLDLPDLELTYGWSERVDLAGVFADPEGDELAYVVSSSRVAVASVTWVSMTGGTPGFVVTALATGSTTISVAADDRQGDVGRPFVLTFAVTVIDGPVPDVPETVPSGLHVVEDRGGSVALAWDRIDVPPGSPAATRTVYRVTWSIPDGRGYVRHSHEDDELIRGENYTIPKVVSGFQYLISVAAAWDHPDKGGEITWGPDSPAIQRYRITGKAVPVIRYLSLPMDQWSRPQGDGELRVEATGPLTGRVTVRVRNALADEGMSLPGRMEPIFFKGGSNFIDGDTLVFGREDRHVSLRAELVDGVEYGMAIRVELYGVQPEATAELPAVAAVEMRAGGTPVPALPAWAAGLLGVGLAAAGRRAARRAFRVRAVPRASAVRGERNAKA